MSIVLDQPPLFDLSPVRVEHKPTPRRKADPRRELVVFACSTTDPTTITILSTGDDPIVHCARRGLVALHWVPGGRAVANQYKVMFAADRVRGESNQFHLSRHICAVLGLHLESTLPKAS